MTSCPCCRQPVAIPPLDDVIVSGRLDGLEAAILNAVWAGNGRAVQTERIFDAMYVDDPDGGPSPTRMYAALKPALRSLNSKLDGLGIAINGVGYRQGYRLSIASKGQLHV